MKARFLVFSILAIWFLASHKARAENLIYNSSFECGASGWHTWGDAGPNVPEGNKVPLGARVVSTNGVARHGANAFFFWPVLWSRPLWLTAGTYTSTFSARGASAGTMKFGLQRTYDLWYTTTPTNDIALTTSWQRFTNTIVIETNGWHLLTFKHPGSTILTWVDGIQLEAGSVATAYAPRTLEFGINSADYYNNLFVADTKQARFNIWNEGAQTNLTIVYQVVSGIWNTNIQNGIITTNALSAATNTTINLTLPTLLGPQRIVAYVTNLNATWDETSITTLPYAAQSGRDTNGLLGIHVAYEHMAHNRRIGFAWARFFSPAFWSVWEEQFPTLTTTNMFGSKWSSDFMYEAAVTNDMIPFVTLTPHDNAWHPQTNASLDVMIGDYTNYVGRMVHRYKDPAYNVHHWEVWNEPQQAGRATVAMYTPSIYANVYTNASRLIKIIDPTAFVIAFGGYSYDVDASTAWAAFTPQGQTDADAVSFHLYPASNGNDDPNRTEDPRSDTEKNYANIRSAFLGVKPMWNTETGPSDIGGYHTIAVAYWYPFYFSEGAASAGEAQFNELESRSLPTVDRMIYNFCRTVGNGIKQFNIQYSRAPDENMFHLGTPTIYELNGSLKPWASALVIGNYFVKTPGLGPITNSGSYYIEGYLHTNTLGVVMPLWRNDRGSCTITTTNGAIALYDTVGNLIQTNATNFVITRSVRYLVSGTLTAIQMSNTVRAATVITNEDTTPPGLTIDMSPIGTVSGGTTNVFKATAIDERVMTYDNATHSGLASSLTNVLYRWTFDDGSSWSPWGTTNHFYKSFASASIYRVGWQAKDAANNTTATTYGPYFGDPSYTPPLVTRAPNIRIGTSRLRAGGR